MKKVLLIQNAPHKIIQNLIFSKIEDTNIVGADFDGSLYKIYYSHSPTHIVFSADRLNEESLQFISDFGSSNTKCFVYHKDISLEVLSKLKDLNAIHLVSSTENLPTYLDNYILVDNVVNTTLFHANNLNDIKKDHIICFLEHIKQMPDELKNYLYPNSKIPIKLFNSKYIDHYQNLGIINEITKSVLLRSNKYYLSLDEVKQNYETEAKLSGATVIKLSDLPHYDKKINDDLETNQIIPIEQFIKERILS
jgi:hypothetical protein